MVVTYSGVGRRQSISHSDWIRLVMFSRIVLEMTSLVPFLEQGMVDLVETKDVPLNCCCCWDVAASCCWMCCCCSNSCCCRDITVCCC